MAVTCSTGWGGAVSYNCAQHLTEATCFYDPVTICCIWTGIPGKPSSCKKWACPGVATYDTDHICGGCTCAGDVTHTLDIMHVLYGTVAITGTFSTVGAVVTIGECTGVLTPAILRVSGLGQGSPSEIRIAPGSEIQIS